MADTTSPVTLQGLSDIISAMQREINDLAVIIMGHTEELGVHSTDISTIQDPPPGVPPTLTQWYGDGHTTKEVDTILGDDLSNLFTASGTNEENITQIAGDLATEIDSRSLADIELQTTDADLQVQIDANLVTLTQEVADRSALSTTVSNQYDDINTRFDSVESSQAALATSGAAAASSSSAQIATINQALQVAQTQILQLQGVGVDPLGAQASQITTLTIISNDAAAATAQETIDRTNADLALQASVNTLNASISGIQSGLDSEVSARIAKDTELATEIGALETAISGSTGAIDAETAARTAADDVLTSDVADNATDIATNQTAIAIEVIDRTDADTSLQAQIDTNSSNISGNISQIATNTEDITQIQGQFGVITDVDGYVTDWQVLDKTAPPGDFLLKDLNNNARLTAPGYPSKYFPPVSVALFSPASAFDADYNGATANDFQGIDTNNYTRPVKMANTFTVALNGSCFLGLDNSTGGNLNRLGQVLTTFTVDFSGYVNRNLSLWYRIKNTASDNTQRWFPAAWAGVSIPSPRTYEFTRGQSVIQISVPIDKVIEFGLTVLHTLDASIYDAANDMIYDASVNVTAFNMVTIS